MSQRKKINGVAVVLSEKTVRELRVSMAAWSRRVHAIEVKEPTLADEVKAMFRERRGWSHV